MLSNGHTPEDGHSGPPDSRGGACSRVSGKVAENCSEPDISTVRHSCVGDIAPSPIVALNRAVAVAEVEGPDAALTLVDGLDLDSYHLFHAIRADLLRRLGRNAEAALAYEAALARTQNASERDFLQRSRQALGRV